MNKLELKHIASYLPYGLRIKILNDSGVVFELDGIAGEVIKYKKGWYHNESKIDKIRLVLRPMSDLVKPCLEGGKIPIVELAKIATGEEYKNYEIELTDYTVMCVDKDESAGFIIGLNSLDMTVTYEAVFNSPLGSPIDIFDYLNQHHFDYRGLIKQGLAIDINTL